MFGECIIQTDFATASEVSSSSKKSLFGSSQTCLFQTWLFAIVRRKEALFCTNSERFLENEAFPDRSASLVRTLRGPQIGASLKLISEFSALREGTIPWCLQCFLLFSEGVAVPWCSGCFYLVFTKRPRKRSSGHVQLVQQGTSQTLKDSKGCLSGVGDSLCVCLVALKRCDL